MATNILRATSCHYNFLLYVTIGVKRNDVFIKKKNPKLKKKTNQHFQEQDLVSTF